MMEVCGYGVLDFDFEKYGRDEMRCENLHDKWNGLYWLYLYLFKTKWDHAEK